MKKAQIRLTPLELGFLFGALKDDALLRMKKDMPTLYYKLSIKFEENYFDHPNLGERAKKDVRQYKQILKSLE